MPLDTEVHLGPGDLVLAGEWGWTLKRGGGTAARHFWPISIVVKQLDGLECYLVWM